MDDQEKQELIKQIEQASSFHWKLSETLNGMSDAELEIMKQQLENNGRPDWTKK